MMRARNKCLQCLENLSMQTIDLSISGKSHLMKKEKHIKKSIQKILKARFSTKQVPAVIFTMINRKIKKLTGTRDAFKIRKKLEADTARIISGEIVKKYKNRLNDLLLFSAAGNSLDFFKEINQCVTQMQSRIYFSLDSTPDFKKALKKAALILFFADNAGEVFFDLPLLKFLAKKTDLYYIVKSSPVQNDLTFAEFRKYVGRDECSFLRPSGNDAVGIELSTLSKDLKKKLKETNLIIAKGMGYYETFTELPQFKGKVFHLLMAKCQPVANSLGVKLNSYVFSRF